jgi:hypothetical protein
MASITVPAAGTPVEIVSALSGNAIVQNVGAYEVIIENAVDPSAGLSLRPGEVINLSSVAVWTLAWNAVSPTLRDVVVRVASQL